MAVITISLQWGSLGDDVANMVCERLGYQRFDKKMMAQVGQELGLTANVARATADYVPPPKNVLEKWMGTTQRITGGDPSSWYFSPRADSLTDLSVAGLMDIIHAGYKKGNVVIVGRGGMAALKDKTDVLHVRIQAPLAVRVKRIQAQEGLTAEDALAQVKARDVSDVDWIRRYFDLDSHSPELFDLIINTAKFTQEAAVDLVVKALDSVPSKGK
jgi:cytidylate kinase